MSEISWITAILQLYSLVADLFGNVIVKRINIRLLDLLARFHYILNLPRTSNRNIKSPLRATKALKRKREGQTVQCFE